MTAQEFFDRVEALAHEQDWAGKHIHLLFSRNATDTYRFKIDGHLCVLRDRPHTAEAILQYGDKIIKAGVRKHFVPSRLVTLTQYEAKWIKPPSGQDAVRLWFLLNSV